MSQSIYIYGEYDYAARQPYSDALVRVRRAEMANGEAGQNQLGRGNGVTGTISFRRILYLASFFQISSQVEDLAEPRLRNPKHSSPRLFGLANSPNRFFAVAL